METNLAERKFYLDTFKSDECLCGRSKKPRFAFCYQCYKKLPPDMQRALYKPFGGGYEQAFEAACKWLQSEVW